MPYTPMPELPEHPDECKKAVRDALQDGHDRMCRIERALAENTRITQENAEKADKVYDALMTMKGGVRAFDLIGRFLRWSAGIGAALYTLWYVINGKSPF